jgi:hypothetical protein
MTRRRPKDSIEHCCVGLEQFQAVSERLRPRRNVANRTVALPIEVSMEGKHIVSSALFLAAGQGHVDRFEIET